MESAFPPSYEEATTKNHWSLTADYLSGADLYAACLVCKQWHSTFAPFLWGNPAGHFGTENDRVYVALTRFKRALPAATLTVRQLTHTLHLPPALSEIYEGPKAEWLRDVLERLPNLQSLLVSQLPFFDHSALVALRRYSRYHVKDSEDDEGDAEFPRFPLRLLIASRCENATSAGLAEALLHLPRLVFLDLSETTAAKGTAVLQSLRFMRDLQVLKLRGLGLKDDDISVLAEAVKIRVRSLDLSSNKLTDESVRTLLSKCFHTVQDVHSQQAELLQQMRRRDSDWPSGVPVPSDSLLIQMRGNDLEEKFLQRLTQPNAGRIISDDLPATGLTHLYISDNFISFEGIASLIRTENLHVFEAATLDTAKALNRSRARSSLSISQGDLPGAEKLTPLLEEHSKNNLTFLRINHTVVTRPSAPRIHGDVAFELAGGDPRFELENPGDTTGELDGTATAVAELPEDAAPMYELSALASTPRYELVANPLESVDPFQRRVVLPQLPIERENESLRNGLVSAPEVVQPPATEDHVDNATSRSNTRSSVDGLPQEIGNTNNVNGPLSEATEDSIDVMVVKIEERRRQLRSSASSTSRGLVPGALPSLRTLVLTEFPPLDDSTGSVISGLQRFIADCALENELAMEQASLEFPAIYAPGKPRSTHRIHRSHDLFSLRQIVLELSPSYQLKQPYQTAYSESSDSPHSPQTPIFRPYPQGFNQPQRSSTGDPDTEAFWRAQENDFTFFGEEECGLPAIDPGRSMPRSTMEEKMAVSPVESDMAVLSPVQSAVLQSPDIPQHSKTPDTESRDVVAELARWRREKKQQAGRLGAKGRSIAGHWTGDIVIVRPDSQKQKGYVNWYGNYFEQGVYR